MTAQPKISLLRGEAYAVNETITIYHPTIREIAAYGEEAYWRLVSLLTATPFDYKVALFDMGIDYEEITDFTLFIMLTQNLSKEETKILFGELDFSRFQVFTRRQVESQEEDIVLRDAEADIIIDEIIYQVITAHLRSMHRTKVNQRKPGNAVTKKIYIEEDRRAQVRNQNQMFSSLLAPLISGLVNCADFKYTYETVWDLHLYAFLDAAYRIRKLQNYRNLMTGIYTGNIDAKSISDKQLDWLGDIE